MKGLQNGRYKEHLPTYTTAESPQLPADIVIVVVEIFTNQNMSHGYAGQVHAARNTVLQIMHGTHLCIILVELQDLWGHVQR